MCIGAVLARVGVKWIDTTLVLVYISAWIGAVLGYYKVDAWGRRFLLIMGYALLSCLWLSAATVVQLGDLDVYSHRAVIHHTASTNTTSSNHTNTIIPVVIIPPQISIPINITNATKTLSNYSYMPKWTLQSYSHNDSHNHVVTSFFTGFSTFTDIFNIDITSSEYTYIFRFIFVTLFCLIAFCYAFTLGSSMTVISAEIFPLRARMKVTGLALSCHMISATTSACFMKSYMLITPTTTINNNNETDKSEDSDRLAQCMVIFAVISIVTCFFVYIMLPETKGQ